MCSTPAEWAVEAETPREVDESASLHRILDTPRETAIKIHGASSRDDGRPSGPVPSRSAAQASGFRAGDRLGDINGQCDARKARPPPQDTVIWPAAFDAR